MAEVCFMLGSNLGDRAMHIGFARGQLAVQAGKELRVSSVYESEPWGYEGSGWFLNQAMVCSTYLKPHELMAIALGIERRMGRVRKGEQGYADRTLDIDLIFINREIIHSPDLVIPHPRLALRRFVLIPLLEVAPGWIHPESGRTPAEMLELCRDTSEVKPCVF